MKKELRDKIRHARQRQQLSTQQYVEGILASDRRILGRAITLLESHRPQHQQQAAEILNQCLPHTGQSFRLGITGVPGVGKSTFIEALGMKVLEEGKKLAVLAIDPTSHQTGGSILGDKTRMAQLSTQNNAFIRPSPAGDSLGGVARKTREVSLLCEAAGYDTIFIETVGVGQSETAVHSMTDFFLLLLLPGGGDELQGIKRGIVEMADLIAVNKSDRHPSLAQQSKRAYRNAVHLFPAKTSGWPVKTMLCSALEQEGISAIWQEILSYYSHTWHNGFFQQKRKEQAQYWFRETIGDGLLQHFYQHPTIQKELPQWEKAVLDGKCSPFAAAEKLLSIFMIQNR